MVDLCIGIDITWWGGSAGKRVSQRETIVAGCIGAPEELCIRAIDLGCAKNPEAHLPTEPNFDGDGHRLIEAMEEVIVQYAGQFDRCIVALDAPLEAAYREGQKPRLKSVRKGEVLGSKRRQCETALSEFKRECTGPRAKDWNHDLRIQSGSPIAPRVQKVIEALKRRGFEICWERDSSALQQVIEIFPSEAIWALGVTGCYGVSDSRTVRAYKMRKPRTLPQNEAFRMACKPLEGFRQLLSTPGAGRLDSDVLDAWIEAIAANACAVSNSRQDGIIAKDKGFDDPIDSGIAFLTAVAYSVGRFHVWGNGNDGVIVGPGELSRVAVQ